MGSLINDMFSAVLKVAVRYECRCIQSSGVRHIHASSVCSSSDREKICALLHRAASAVARSRASAGFFGYCHRTVTIVGSHSPAAGANASKLPAVMRFCDCTEPSPRPTAATSRASQPYSASPNSIDLNQCSPGRIGLAGYFLYIQIRPNQ